MTAPTSADPRTPEAVPATPVSADEAIRVEVARRLRTYADRGPRWQLYVHNGQVDIIADPDSSSTTCALIELARTVPGVTGVRIFCGQSAAGLLPADG